MRPRGCAARAWCVWRVVRIAEPRDLDRLEPRRHGMRTRCWWSLGSRMRPGARAFRWTSRWPARPAPGSAGSRMVLAGGLTPETVGRGRGPRSTRGRRCKFWGGKPARHQGPRQDRGISGGGVWPKLYRLSARSRDGSARTADGTSPRRSSPRSTISRRCTTACGGTRLLGGAGPRCSRSTSAARRRSPPRRGCRPRSARPVVLKREDLNHTGAHKINNTMGQALLALRMGKRAHHRGDRRRAARRRDRHGLRAVRARVRGLHGRGGRRAAGAQRLPHAAPRRDRGAGRVGHPHAQGRDQRGAARLGDQRPDDALHHRLRRRARSVSPHGARLPVGHRPGGARADAGAAGAGCPRRSWPAWAAARTRSASSPPSWTTRTWSWSASRRRGRGSAAARHSATLSAGTPGVLHGSLSYLLQDADGQVAPAHSVSAGLDYPGVGPEHSWLRDSGRVALRLGHRSPRRSTRSRRSRGWRGSSPRSRRRTRSPGCAAAAGGGRTARPVLVCLSGRGDKDVAHVAALLGAPA